jgi:RNA polymerase sigma-70 factor (ECF subfamily)
MGVIDNTWAEIAIRQNSRWLRAYVLSSTGDHSACDDLVQEVFAIAYQKRDTFAAGTNFGGWLRVIARNVIRRHVAQRARVPLFSHDEAIAQLDQVAAESEEPSCDVSDIARRKQFLKECLKTITPRVRRLLHLRYEECQPTQLVAKLLQMSVTAVDVAAFRSKMALAKCIEGKEKAPPT